MYNAYDICREILDYYNLDEYSEWIGTSDIGDYLDKYYEEMSTNDRWFVFDRMEKFVDYIDDYHSVMNIEDDFCDEYLFDN